MDHKTGLTTLSNCCNPDLDYRQLLADNHALLRRSVVISNQLIRRLKRMIHCAFCDSDIRNQTTLEDRYEAFLDVLDRLPDDQFNGVFETFLTALREDGQEHVANVFHPVSEARPMSDEHYKLLVNKRSEICQFIELQNGLIDQLINAEVISDCEGCRVLKKTEIDPASSEIIDILVRKPDNAFDRFVHALCATGQEHITEILGQQSDKSQMLPEHTAVLIKERASICQFLDPIYSGLVDWLTRVGVLTERERVVLEVNKGFDAMSRALVDLFLRKSDWAFQKFLEALRSTDHSHVCCILTGDGEPPLKGRRAEVLREGRDTLLNNIESEYSLLIDKLYATGVINDRLKQHLEAKQTNVNKNRLLLDAIARKSEPTYGVFLQALRDTGSEHVAAFLDGLELDGIIETHFSTECSEEHQRSVAADLRDRLRLSFVDLRNDVDATEVFTQIQNCGISVTAVEEGSIVIRFRCADEDSLRCFRKLLKSEVLDRMLTETFCPPFLDAGLCKMKLMIPAEKLDLCAARFRELALMTSEHRSLLHDAVPRVGEKIHVTDELLSKLSICTDRRETILATADNRKQIRTLFDIVSRQPDKVFQELVNALRDSGQHEAANLLLYRDENAVIYQAEGGAGAPGSDLENPDLSDCETESSGSTLRQGRMDRLPLEMLEKILMKAFIVLFKLEHQNGQPAYNSLAVTCQLWRQTLQGFPQSSTKHWVKHQLRIIAEKLCRPYLVQPRLNSAIETSLVFGVASTADNLLYTVHRDSETVSIFDPNNGQLPAVNVPDMDEPWDVVADPDSGVVYIADCVGRCVYRVSPNNNNHVEKWPPNKSSTTKSKIKPFTLSVTSRRLLVTSRTDELVLYGSDGEELKHIKDFESSKLEIIRHAMETPRGTIVVCHFKPKPGVCEIDMDGKVICSYGDKLEISDPRYVLSDSDDRLIVADYYKNRVLLLNSRMELERVLLDTELHGLVLHPWRMDYVEKTGLLIVSGYLANCVQVFNVR